MFRPLTAASNTLIAPCTSLVGFSLRETAASTAVIRLRNGSASGAILFTLSFAASEAITIILPVVKYQNALSGGFYCASGVYVETVSGTVEGSLFTL